ncbi:MAG TPA: hypothetical protein VIM69_08840 [Opitutaceae bacterium]
MSAFLSKFRFFVTTSLFGAIFALAGSYASARPNDWTPSPIEVVSENVHVSVGDKLALVVGRYWYQYNRKFDDGISPRIAIYYATFVPKSYASRSDIIDISQIRLTVGEQSFTPETARILTDEEVGAIQVAPKDFAVAWFVFQIPRAVAKLRFDVLIEHGQPLYDYEGKHIAAYLPWLPELESTRKDLELKDSDFVVTFEALPKVTFKPESINTKVVESTDTKLVVHPVHLENIAVSVTHQGG